MVRIASHNSQVILATQSPLLVDEFEARQIVVAEWNQSDESTRFRRLDLDALKEWVHEYSLSELWEKNVFGGLP
jgi:predicted ATPase